VLEARDVMRVLSNHPEAPMDLRQKALRLAGRMLEFDPDVRGGDGFGIARDILDSGRALERMQAIIAAQGARPFDPDSPPLAPHAFDVVAPEDGVVIAIDNLKLARIARLAGAPKATGAGVDLAVRIGDEVRAGQRLYTVYAAFRNELALAHRSSERDSGFTLGHRDQLTRLNVEM
jgi:thymidine phosphorylase